MSCGKFSPQKKTLHTNNHPREELSEFGYKEERSIFIKNPTIFWQLLGIIV
jgi:hypothetical protein